MSIPDIILKIKRGKGAKKILIVILLLSSHISLFLLGMVSENSFFRKNTPVKIIYPPLMIPKSSLITEKNIESSEKTNPEESFEIIASKSGTVYYPKDCTAYTRIKEENRVYFTSESEAITAGLQKSSRCP